MFLIIYFFSVQEIRLLKHVESIIKNIETYSRNILRLARLFQSSVSCRKVQGWFFISYTAAHGRSLCGGLNGALLAVVY